MGKRFFSHEIFKIVAGKGNACGTEILSSPSLLFLKSVLKLSSLNLFSEELETPVLGCSVLLFL